MLSLKKKKNKQTKKQKTNATFLEGESPTLSQNSIKNVQNLQNWLPPQKINPPPSLILRNFEELRKTLLNHVEYIEI